MDVLDTSWMEEEMKLTSLEYPIVPEALPYLWIKILYVNEDLTLKEEVLTTKITFATTTEKNILLKKEQLIHLSQQYKKSTNASNFILKDLILFHIPIEMNSLKTFIGQSFPSDPLIHTFSIIDDIQLEPSLFIFHPYNTLYLIYYEMAKKDFKLQSAMKSTSKVGQVTKRVQMKLSRMTKKRELKNVMI